MKTGFLGGLAVAVTACGSAPHFLAVDGEPLAATEAELSLESLLIEGVSLELPAAAGASSTVSFVLDGALASERPAVELDVIGGYVSVSLHDGNLWVEDLSVACEDVEIDRSDLISEGLRFVGMETTLAQPVAAVPQWSDNAVSMSGMLDLELDWGWQTLEEGAETYPLQTQPASGMAFKLTIEMSEGVLRAGLTAARQGLVWTMDGLSDDEPLLQMHDPAIDLDASN